MYLRNLHQTRVRDIFHVKHAFLLQGSHLKKNKDQAAIGRTAFKFPVNLLLYDNVRNGIYGKIRAQYMCGTWNYTYGIPHSLRIVLYTTHVW